MHRIRLTAAVLFAFHSLVFVSVVSAQQPKDPAQQPKDPAQQPKDPAQQPAAGEDKNSEAVPPAAEDGDREQKLAEYLSGATFSGKFTIDGKEDATPKTEQYTISKCEKLPAPDMYRMTARIKYGEIDAEVPLAIKILWSGNTPVITLDSFWIPGMGSFGARILIHSDRYAGTWQHDAVGGHMFGQIKK